MLFPRSWNIFHVDLLQVLLKSLISYGKSTMVLPFNQILSTPLPYRTALHFLNTTGCMKVTCMIPNNLQTKMLKYSLLIPAKDQHKTFKINSPYHVVFDFLQDVIIGHNQFFCCRSICYIGKYT